MKLWGSCGEAVGLPRSALPPAPVWLQVPCLPAPSSPGGPTLESPAVLTVLWDALRRTGGSLGPSARQSYLGPSPVGMALGFPRFMQIPDVMGPSPPDCCAFLVLGFLWGCWW